MRSVPEEEEIIYDLDELVSGCIKCNQEMTHICQHDIFVEEVDAKYLNFLIYVLNNEKDDRILTEIDFSESNILKVKQVDN